MRKAGRTSTVRTAPQPGRARGSALCSSLDGAREHRTKGNERERETPYGVTRMQNLRHDTDKLVYET